MARNLATKFSSKVAERFAKNSLTASAASNAYDWDGVDTIKVYSVDTVPLTDYSRAGTSRYGTPADLTDSTQTMQLSQDKAFTYIIDKGDDEEQFNIKKANRALQREIDERVTPHLDIYNMAHWIAGAGSVVTYTTAPNKTNIIEAFNDCVEALDEAFAPESGRVAFIKNSKYKLIKNAEQFQYTDKLASDAIIKGQVGELEGIKIVKCPDSYFPDDVDMLIVHKSALLAPVKLREYQIHSNPPGINGDLTEGRILHDAFVLDAKAKAVCAYGNASAAAATPVVTLNKTAGADDAVKITKTAGDEIYYTIDGSDPRCSGTAVKATANVTLPAANVVGATKVRAVVFDGNKAISFGKEASASF